MTVPKWPALAVLSLAVAACRGVNPGPAPGVPSAGAPTTAPRAANAGVRYRIDAAHSELRVLVYRTGPLASLGHNHVLVHHGLGGWLAPASAGTDGSAAAGTFHLQFASAGFDVDNGEDRGRAGADFAAEVAPDARAGTLHNLLSESQLDDAHHPDITVAGVVIEGRDHALSATVEVGVAGHAARLTLPFTLERGNGRMHARAAFDLRQTVLGITPFAVFLGALRVEDEMQVSIDLVAVRGPAGARGD